MKRFLRRAALLGLLSVLFYGAAPFASTWFTKRFLPSRMSRAGTGQLEGLEAMHRRALEALRALDRPARPLWTELALARDRLGATSFILASDPQGRPLAWAGHPRELAFVEGVRAAFTPDRLFLVHAVGRPWGRLTVAQTILPPEEDLFIRSAVFRPATAFPALPTPEDPDARTFLFKPGGPPLLALQLRGVPAAVAIRNARRILGGALAAAWLLLLFAHRRDLPRWSVPALARLTLLLFPFALLPLPASWTDPAAFSLPGPRGLAGSPLEAALTVLAIALSLMTAAVRPCRGWGLYAGWFLPGAAGAAAAAHFAVRGAGLGALPSPLPVALAASAWALGHAALVRRPEGSPPRWLPWLALALPSLLLAPPLPAFVALLGFGSLGLAAWRREAVVPAAMAALWGLALPHAMASADLRAYLNGPHASLRLQRPSLEVLELGRVLPRLMKGWDWRERVEYFPLLDDPSPLAYAMSRALGLEGGGVDYSVTLYKDGALLSINRTAHFPLPAADGAEPGAVRADPREPDLYGGTFPLLDGGRPWGSAVVQFRPRPPTAPARDRMPVQLGLYDRGGNLLEAGSVFFPVRLDPRPTPALPGWSALVAEGDRQALLYVPAWEFPFPHLPFALLLLAGVLLSLPRPIDPRGLMTLAMMPLAALLALAAVLAFTFTARQERDLRALQEQWTAVAQKNLLDEAAGVLPDLVYEDGLMVGGTEAGPALRYAPAPLMASMPLARPRTMEVRGRTYLFFTDTAGRLCALQQPNLPGLERPVAWLARRTWGILLACLAAAFMAFLFLLRRFTEPVARLAASARAVQAGGPFTPGGLSASREINDLAGALRDAIDRLRHEEGTLREILAGLPVGVALLKEGETLFQNGPMTASGITPEFLDGLPDHATFTRDDRLYLARRVPLPGGRRLLLASDISAEMTAQKLTAFAEIARIVAHEVKNPLTPIRLSIDYLKELAGRDPGKFRKDSPGVLDEIALSLNDLEHAAMEFADFARLPALQRGRADLIELISAWLAPYQASGAVRFKAPDRALPVEADPRLLKRALFNLLSNAWQSASPPPPVMVRLDAGERWALIQIEDEGPGVLPDALPRLFEPYFTTKSSGTGLGLLIARRIVEEHGGSIEARNRPEGGLVVEVRLPLHGSSESGVRSPE